MLKHTFCSSPWFHVKVSHAGDFVSCRWGKESANSTQNVKSTSILEFYNSDQMRSLRISLLDGQAPTQCSECYYQDSFNKLNGRRRQLNKSAISVDNFELTLRSSPHYELFKHSYNNNGHSQYTPVDLQIDLGNLCNSACIMCHPSASSRLAAEYKKLHLVNKDLFESPTNYSNWTKDQATLDKFIAELVTIPNLKYIHFLGGETLYDEAFYKICNGLIEHGIANNITVGTTTNGTIHSQRLEKIIAEFKEFHLGISIESVTELNDYIRWPGKITNILGNIDKFLNLRQSMPTLNLILRITPNLFSIYELDQLVEYMIEKNITAESCNILVYPEYLRMELMPEDIRKEILAKLDALTEKYQFEKTNIVNARRHDLAKKVIADMITDYASFIRTYTAPEDIKTHQKNLVQSLKAFESIRGNSILNYAPRYEKFLRSCGY